MFWRWSGSGTFRVDQLATFTGFERIRLNNATSYGSANLTLGSQPIEVDATGLCDYSSKLAVELERQQHHQRRCLADGDRDRSDFLQFGLSGGLSTAAGNLRSDLEYVLACEHIRLASNITLLINNADTAGVQSFSGVRAERQAGDRRIDARPFPHDGERASRSPAPTRLGTAFTVGDLGTAFQIAGGSGQDTIIARASPSAPTSATAIFATASVEKIIDQSGTYTAPPPSPGVVGLTTGNDTIVSTFLRLDSVCDGGDAERG